MKKALLLLAILFASCGNKSYLDVQEEDLSSELAGLKKVAAKNIYPPDTFRGDVAPLEVIYVDSLFTIGDTVLLCNNEVYIIVKY